jgi:LysM repeat protein
MKILKIFGIVVAVHAAVFMFIFAIPGCRSTGKPAGGEASAESASPVAATADSPAISPILPVSTAPLTANASSAAGVRFSPTRPGTTAAAELTPLPVAPAKSAPAPTTTYVVARGDSLWTIAKKHGVTTASLAAANNISTSAVLPIGKKLLVPAHADASTAALTASTSTAQAASKPTESAKGEVTYKVKPNETLSDIAKKFQVKLSDIAVANHITNPNKLSVGQELKIPGWQSTGEKAATAVTTSPRPAPEPMSPLIAVPPAEISPLITPLPDGPIIKVEETGAPKIP